MVLLVTARPRSARGRVVAAGLAAVVVAIAAAALSACGGADEPPREQRARSSAETAADGTVVVARTRQLRRGERALLLRLPRVGRLTARCSAHDAASVAFTAAPFLPTAAVTVASPGRAVIRRIVHPEQRVAIPPSGPSDFQTWQVEPFAKAGVRVTTISVAMGRSPGTPVYACGFSAHAATTNEAAEPES